MCKGHDSLFTRRARAWFYFQNEVLGLARALPKCCFEEHPINLLSLNEIDDRIVLGIVLTYKSGVYLTIIELSIMRIISIR